jgi:hypothetical protein
MNDPHRKPPFFFAEIAVTAPWAYDLVAQHWDKDKAVLLQRNNAGDERWAEPVDAGAVDAGAVDAGAVDAGAVDAGAVDAGAMERARAARARYLGALIQRVTAALFHRRTPARA